MATVKPQVKGCKFIQGRRYLINTKTGVTYPYNDAFAKNPFMVEFFPVYPKDAVEQVEQTIEAGSTEEPVVIEEVVVEEAVVAPVEAKTAEVKPAEAKTEEKPLKPWQMAQLAKQKKAEAKVGV